MQGSGALWTRWIMAKVTRPRRPAPHPGPSPPAYFSRPNCFPRARLHLPCRSQYRSACCRYTGSCWTRSPHLAEAGKHTARGQALPCFCGSLVTSTLWWAACGTETQAFRLNSAAGGGACREGGQPTRDHSEGPWAGSLALVSGASCSRNRVFSSLEKK